MKNQSPLKLKEILINKKSPDDIITYPEITDSIYFNNNKINKHEQ